MNRSAYLAVAGHQGPPPERLRPLLDRLHRDNRARLVDVPGLLVFGDPIASHLILPNAGGLIWGHLFEGLANSRVLSSRHPAIEADSTTFLSRLWGGYLAIRCREGAVEILRDPSGTVSCYHAALEGVHILTSQPTLLFETGLLARSIDWTILAQTLVYRDLRPARTALRGISEVLPGTRLIIRRGVAQSSCIWSPWDFARADQQIAGMAIARERLRDTINATLGAWSGCFSHPLLEISGGLDSSIVASGFAGASSAHCLTFGPGPDDSDERPWAREIAKHLGLPLTELRADETRVDITRSDASDIPRPCARVLSQALDRPIQTHAQTQRTDAFLGGGGGDSMFCLLHSALPVVDRYRHEGLSAGLFETAADIAQITHTDIWSVLRAAIPRALRRPSQMPRPSTNPFVSEDARNGLPWPEGNPWLAAPDGIAPGKRRHVWSILAIYNHLEGYGREAIAPCLVPLMSQPIFEICMAIPSWLWCQGGNNRAVTREAFRQALPATIIDRRTKVSFNGIVQRVLDAHKDTIREMVLNGALAREGIINRDAIGNFLDHPLASARALPEIMAVVDTEAWLSSQTAGSGPNR
ncbi:asparagine synthase-related protein [Sphingomonas sp. CJ20]